MDQQAREQAFISALTTEQFVLQAPQRQRRSDDRARHHLYGRSVQRADRLWVPGPSRHPPGLGCRCVLPAVFLLGEFTFAALLRNTLENLVLLRQMQRIRGYYRTLVPSRTRRP
jgi:hypothetical protein